MNTIGLGGRTWKIPDLSRNQNPKSSKAMARIAGLKVRLESPFQNTTVSKPVSLTKLDHRAINPCPRRRLWCTVSIHAKR